MAFADVSFPDDIAYGSAGGPEFSTDIVTTHSGHEQRNSNWSQARIRYNVATGVRTAVQLESLISFFRARKGQAEGFRFKDWTDYQATAQPIGAGNGILQSFQLIKQYSSGGVVRSRTITKPVEDTVLIYVDGALQSSGVQVDTTSGQVQFDSPPASGTSIWADYEFDVPMRFATDHLSARLQEYGVYTTLDIPLIEVRI